MDARSESSKERMKQLFERYMKSYAESTGLPGSLAKDYSEQDTATKFIKPLIEALGWNPLSMQEVREEVSLKDKRIDCVLYSSGKPHIVFEFKSLGFGVLHGKFDASELINNAKALHAKYAVLSRFRETIVYDPATGKEVYYFVLEDYVEKFGILWKYLSKI